MDIPIPEPKNTPMMSTNKRKYLVDPRIRLMT
jgi:hypothetical protein